MLSNLLTHTELSDMSESESINESYRYKAELLLQACEDWPLFDVAEPVTFIDSLRAEVGKELTYKNLNCYFESGAVKGDVWRLTALVSVLEMFREGGNFLEHLELESLVSVMTSCYRRSV